MLKKMCALLVVLIMITASTAIAFAGNPDGIGNTSSPAIADMQQSSTTGSSVSTGDVKTGTTSEGAISGTEANNAKNNKLVSPKPDFESIFQNALKNGRAMDNGQFMVIITSPDKDKDSTYKKSYILSGNSEYDDVIISIAKYNDATGEYEQMSNTDGESSWEISSAGFFSKEILLTKGTNKIKIMSYSAAQKEESKLQINCFTIELLDETIAERVVKKTAEIGANVGKDIGNSVQQLINFLGGKSK